MYLYLSERDFHILANTYSIDNLFFREVTNTQRSILLINDQKQI